MKKFSFSLKQIDKEIAELNEAWEAEIAVEQRLSKEFGEFVSKIEKQKTPESPRSKSVSLIEKAHDILELHPREAEIYKERLEAARIINPCFVAGPLGPYYCQYTASSMNKKDNWGYGNYTSTCNTTLGQGVNEIDALAVAKGTPGQSNAQCWPTAWFAFPAYPSNAKIFVDTCIDFHGEVVQHPNAFVSLWVITRGYQGSYNYVSQTHTTNLLTNTPGQSDCRRYDYQLKVSFIMDVYPTPFKVQVWMGLQAKATGAGSEASIDFSTGTNRIRILWVNTQPLRI